MDDKIKKAIASIDKKWGKGNVVSLTDEDHSIKKCPSGSMKLDLALGGGYPYGRIIEAYGPESSGKCLDFNALVLTSEGWRSVREVFENKGLPVLTTNKEVPVKDAFINKDGKIELTTHFTYNSKKPVIEIKTQSGFVHRRTYKHPLLSIDRNGIICWKWTGELQEGDYLIRRKFQYFGNEVCKYDTAYAMGLLLADGCLMNLSISNDDDSIKRFIETKMKDALSLVKIGIVSRSRNSCGTITVQYGLRPGVSSQKFLQSLDLEPCIAKDKSIPQWVRSLDKASMIAFIRGFMDVESYVNKSGIEVSSASYEMMYQLKHILLQFDIESNLQQVFCKDYPDNEYWRLYICGKNCDIYLKEIGFTSDQKISQARDLIAARNSIRQDQSNIDCIPFIEELIFSLYRMQPQRSNQYNRLIGDLYKNDVRCSRNKLKKILDMSENSWLKEYLTSLLDYGFEKIISVERKEAVPTADFAMESTHTFVADGGTINHNTTVALHAIAEAQKQNPDRCVAYIDTEYAFDSDYAEALGVDLSPERFIFVQPEHGEQAFDIIETFLKTGEFSMIVVDSVAAMIPRAELEGEMGESKMGLHARLMSQGMRKLTGLISKSDCILFFINQLRDKVGVLYGNPETTTGGNALKFYASQRLDIRRIKTVKTGDESVANEVRVTVKKNKVAPPFRKAEITIVFGKGIDTESEILDVALEAGIIENKGAYYYYNGERLAQGMNRLKDLLEAEPLLYNEIKDATLIAIRENKINIEDGNESDTDSEIEE